jgi:hypothetical protein
MRRCTLLGSCRLALLCMVAATSACGDARDEGADAALAACTAGESVACVCDDGRTGEALCRADQRADRCRCEPARTTPCSAPGEVFACTCSDGASGDQVCLRDGRYSRCACAGAGATLDDAGRTTPPDLGSEPEPARAACPVGFSCTEQMGYRFCADSTQAPPLCSTALDCSAAGLPDAACLDPGLGGVTLCVQLCAL